MAVKSVAVNPTITAGAYSANDVVGGLLSFRFVPAALAGSDPATGILTDVVISDDDNEKAVLALHLFREEPSTIADNAAFAPTFADLKKRFAVIDIAAADYVTINSNAQAVIDDQRKPFDAPTGVVYGYLVCTSTPTYTATTDLSVLLTASLD